MFDELWIAEEKAEDETESRLEQRYKNYVKHTDETYPKSFEEWLGF